jgi:hypothetical protein
VAVPSITVADVMGFGVGTAGITGGETIPEGHYKATTGGVIAELVLEELGTHRRGARSTFLAPRVRPPRRPVQEL